VPGRAALDKIATGVSDPWRMIVLVTSKVQYLSYNTKREVN